jgi:hypothetical protein
MKLTTQQPLATVFHWRTHDGQSLPVDQMETRHLVYSLRMIFNHIAPEHLRVPGGKRWSGIDQWDLSYLKDAVGAMLVETGRRRDLTPEHRGILAAIKAGADSLRGTSKSIE